MFTLGSFDASSTPGLTATLQSWLSLPGLSIATVDVPGQDGAFYADSTLGKGAWTFNIEARAATPTDVLTLAGLLSQACAPTKQLQSLTLDVAPGWVWYAAASAPIVWERQEWDPGARCTLTGKLELACPDPYGYAVPDDTASGSTTATITRTKGNLASFPTITVEGAFTAVSISIGSAVLDVAVPVAAGQRLVLDYQLMEFAVWSGSTKVRHAAPGMSSFSRVELPLGPTTITATATGGAVTALSATANSRRA